MFGKKTEVMYIMCPICFANLARRANKKGDK